jgi:hypothetical protein
MREIFVLILSIIAIIAILYPIRPGWKNHILREHYDLHAPQDKTTVIRMNFSSGTSKEQQQLQAAAAATQAKLVADSEFDTVDETHIKP